jgi:hypothetical protein
MQSKKVTRYACDFCEKKGYSLGAMRRHEAHCTLNPNRGCRMCEAAGDWPAPTPDELAAVVALVPKYENFTAEDVFFRGKAQDDLKVVWPEIVERLHDCPACIMAALRQAGFPVPAVDWWNYTDACKEFWKPINEDKARCSAWADCI